MVRILACICLVEVTAACRPRCLLLYLFLLSATGTMAVSGLGQGNAPCRLCRLVELYSTVPIVGTNGA